MNTDRRSRVQRWWWTTSLPLRVGSAGAVLLIAVGTVLATVPDATEGSALPAAGANEVSPPTTVAIPAPAPPPVLPPPPPPAPPPTTTTPEPTSTEPEPAPPPPPTATPDDGLVREGEPCGKRKQMAFSPYGPPLVCEYSGDPPHHDGQLRWHRWPYSPN